MILLLAGCTADLLPGELVLGDEIPAAIRQGQAGSALGTSVAFAPDGGSVLVSAPGAGEVLLLDLDATVLWTAVGPPGLGRRVGWADGRPWAWAPGEGLYWLDDGAAVLAAATPAATTALLCTGERPLLSNLPGAALDCSEQGDLLLACEGEACAVWADRDADGAFEERIATSSPGSAVQWWEGRACWGDARGTGDASPGAAWCEGGEPVEGLDGDHLGATLGGGWAAGVFNRWQVPARARVVPMSGGGEVWAIDRAAERTRIAVSAAGGRVAVGVPGYGGERGQEGRVYLVEGG